MPSQGGVGRRERAELGLEPAPNPDRRRPGVAAETRHNRLAHDGLTIGLRHIDAQRERDLAPRPGVIAGRAPSPAPLARPHLDAKPTPQRSKAALAAARSKPSGVQPPSHVRRPSGSPPTLSSPVAKRCCTAS